MNLLCEILSTCALPLYVLFNLQEKLKFLFKSKGKVDKVFHANHC